MKRHDFGMVILLAFLCAFFGMLLGLMYAQHQTRSEAAKAGAARYVADPITGETRFEWATNCVEVAQ